MKSGPSLRVRVFRKSFSPFTGHSLVSLAAILMCVHCRKGSVFDDLMCNVASEFDICMSDMSSVVYGSSFVL